MKNKVLIVGPAWVGDMVMAQSLFILLKQQNPTVKIHVLAPPWSNPLLERMPEVEKAIELPISHGQLQLKKRYQIAMALQHEAYDQAIVLPNSFKSALIPFFARIPLRTSWLGECRFVLLNDYRFLNKPRYALMIERFIALALTPNATLPIPLPHPQLRVDSVKLAETLDKFALNPKAKLVLALCPGAEFGSSKRWPEQHYASVANEKINQGWQVWLFGSAKDQVVTKAINQATHNQCIDLSGKTSLAEAIDLLSIADAVVSNDSGLMHIAAALQRNLVVVYGSTSPHFTPPLNENKKIVRLNLSCSPCFKRDCPLQHKKCLVDLLPTQVIKSLDELIVL